MESIEKLLRTFTKMRAIGDEIQKKRRQLEWLHGQIGKSKGKEVLKQIRKGDNELNEIDKKWCKACEELDNFLRCKTDPSVQVK